ncbi:hypothetical protein BJ138DRAFT_169349 [Hygrophoropsis aurantiaca]|uniref:Uncharacterized protein n=1 Tax=Hygrophoropsis aurantiaca TaxID=72124 RepID=A0ACB8A943_9AGAM|nr:hypothetical protein BJ138DRAFT_169349 [Hygrophoropsis aurantiaca]
MIYHSPGAQSACRGMCRCPSQLLNDIYIEDGDIQCPTIMNNTLLSVLTPAPTTNVGVLIGPVELGVFVAIFLFGCSVVQGYIYYSTFRDDPWYFKFLVTSALTVETAHIMSIAAYVWNTTVTTYGNPGALTVFPAGADMAILCTSLVSWLVQSFYIVRLARFSNTRVFPAICAAISALSNITSLVIAGKAFVMNNLAQFESAIFRMITVSLAAKAVCDLAIAIGMVYHLRKRRPGFLQTVYAIDRLIRWTLEASLLTGLNSILVLVFFLAMRQNFIWVGLYTFLACNYANALLASLNSRVHGFSKRSDKAYEINNVDSSSPTHPRILSVCYRQTKC